MGAFGQDHLHRRRSRCRIQNGVYPSRRPCGAARGRQPCRQVPRARDVPHPLRERACAGFQWPHPARRQSRQVRQLAGNGDLHQEPQPAGHLVRQERDFAQRQVHPCGGQRGHGHAASVGNHQRGGLLRHCAHGGADTPHPQVHRERYHNVRRRQRRHTRRPARHQSGAGRGPEREGGAAARGRGSRLLRAQAHAGRNAAVHRRQRA